MTNDSVMFSVMAFPRSEFFFKEDVGCLLFYQNPMQTNRRQKEQLWSKSSFRHAFKKLMGIVEDAFCLSLSQSFIKFPNAYLLLISLLKERK